MVPPLSVLFALNLSCGVTSCHTYILKKIFSILYIYGTKSRKPRSKNDNNS